MRRPGWAARLAALVLAAVLAGGAAEGAEPFRTVWRGYVIGGPAGALPSEPAVFATKEAFRRFLGRTGLEGLVFAEPVDFSREQAVYAAHRAAALSFTAEGPDIVWETEPGGSAYLITGPEAVPMTEVFLLAAPKSDGKARRLQAVQAAHTEHTAAGFGPSAFPAASRGA